MPYKRSYKPRSTFKRKPRVFKRKSRYSKSQRPPIRSGPFKTYSNLEPFKPHYRAKLHYTESFTLTTGAAGIYGTEQVFQLNSMYDPNFSGTGHQPYGYDQVSALYRKYKVNAAKIELIFTNPSEDGMIVGATLQPSSSTASLTGKTIDVIKEQPMSTTRCINNSGKQVTRLSQYVTMSQLEGLTRSQWHNNMTDYGAGVGSNPTLMPYLRVANASSVGTSGATVYCRFSITFYATFFDRITQSQS